MTEHDIPMLHDWLNRRHIAEWWGGDAQHPTLAQTREDYLASVMAEHHVTPCIALLGDAPIGYAQSYVVIGAGGGWWPNETDSGARGIDPFLADGGLLNQGLGTRLVEALCHQLFDDPEVTRIQADPTPANLRAICCYEKAGFVQIGPVVTPDGPAIYMLRERPVPASRVGR